MPRLPTLERRLPRATRGVQNFQAAGAGISRAANIQSQEAGQVGTGLMSLAQGLGAAGQSFERIAQSRQQAADKLAMARARSKWLAANIEVQNAFEGDPDYQTYDQRYTEGMSKVGKEISDALPEHLRPVFETETLPDVARGRGSLFKKAYAKENDIFRSNIDQLQADNLEAALQAQDPATSEALIDQTNTALRAGVLQGAITNEDAGERQRDFAGKFSISRHKILPPEERLQALTNGMSEGKGGLPVFKKTGAIVDHMPVAERVRMIEQTKQEVSAIQNESRLATERADRAAKEELRKAREEVANGFITRLHDPNAGPELTYQEVSESNLSPEQKRSFFTALDADIDKNVDTNYAVYNDLYSKVADGRINAENMATEVLPFVGSEIKPEDYTRLRSFAETIKGQEADPLVKQFLAMAKPQITKTTILQNDPTGEALYYQFAFKFNQRLQTELDKGVPLQDLLNPESTSYLGDMVTPYVRTPGEEIRDMAARIKGEAGVVGPRTPQAELQRLEGETAEDFLLRLQAP